MSDECVCFPNDLDESRRLEAMRMALAWHQGRETLTTVDDVVKMAEKLETYLIGMAT